MEPDQSFPLSGGDAAVPPCAASATTEAAPKPAAAAPIKRPRKTKDADAAAADGVSGTAAPAKKPKSTPGTKKTSTAAAVEVLDPEEMLLTYLLRVPQPFVTQGAVDALGGKIKKPQMQLTIDKLLAENKLKAKTFKKNIVYFPPWEVPAAADDDADIDNNNNNNNSEDLERKQLITKLQSSISDLQTMCSHLEADVSSLTSHKAKLSHAPTLQQLLDTEKSLISETSRLMERTQQIRGGGASNNNNKINVTPEEYRRAVQTYNYLRSEWQLRREKALLIVRSVASDVRSDGEVKDDLGLEYDEDVGISISTFPTQLS
eukprot:PhM_4_TR4440/c0_g1_i1/m.55106/K06695/PSMC3IP; 26S proteasome regulatory subunit, ATPase 3, interacting protein